jgi:hypothetical protein
MLAPLVGGVIAVGAYARFVEPNWIKVRNLRLRWRGPRLRVVVLSDFHARAREASRYARIVRKVNELGPDLVLLGGDYLDGLDASGEKLASLAPVKELVAERGVFGVLGNHDSQDVDEHEVDGPVEPAVIREPAIVDALRRMRVHVLDNEHVEVGGVKLIGMGSFRAKKSDPVRAFDGIAPHDPRLVLVHNWQSLRLPGVGPFDLAIAGHTHGGQACVPFTGICPFLEEDMLPYSAGLYRWERGGRLYVTRGLGTSELRARFGVRPEIAVLDLI